MIETDSRTDGVFLLNVLDIGVCHLNLFLLQFVNITTPKIVKKENYWSFFDILDWMSLTIPSNWSTFISILTMFFRIVSFCKFRVLIIWSATGSRLLASTPILFLKQTVYNYIKWIEVFWQTQMEAGSIIEFQSKLQFAGLVLGIWISGCQ